MFFTFAIQVIPFVEEILSDNYFPKYLYCSPFNNVDNLWSYVFLRKILKNK